MFNKRNTEKSIWKIYRTMDSVSSSTSTPLPASSLSETHVLLGLLIVFQFLIIYTVVHLSSLLFVSLSLNPSYWLLLIFPHRRFWSLFCFSLCQESVGQQRSTLPSRSSSKVTLHYVILPQNKQKISIALTPTLLTSQVLHKHCLLLL